MRRCFIGTSMLDSSSRMSSEKPSMPHALLSPYFLFSSNLFTFEQFVSASSIWHLCCRLLIMDVIVLLLSITATVFWRVYHLPCTKASHRVWLDCVLGRHYIQKVEDMLFCRRIEYCYITERLLPIPCQFYYLEGEIQRTVKYNTTDIDSQHHYSQE